MYRFALTFGALLILSGLCSLLIFGDFTWADAGLALTGALLGRHFGRRAGRFS